MPRPFFRVGGEMKNFKTGNDTEFRDVSDGSPSSPWRTQYDKFRLCKGLCKLSKSGLFILSALAASDLALQFFPFTSEFGYEFAFVNSILLWFAGGFAAFGFCKRIRRDECGLVNFIYAKPFFLALLVVTPVIISFAFNCCGSCPFGFGVKYYIFFSFFSFLYSIIFSLTLIKTGVKWKTLIFFLFTFLLILIPLIEIYSYPQIYSYSVLLGYFPGTIYDKFIPVTEKLILYRFIILVLFSLVYYLSYKTYHAKSLIYGSALFLFWVALLKPPLGFDTNSTRVKNETMVSSQTAGVRLRFFYSAGKKEVVFKTMEQKYLLGKITDVTKLKISSPINSYIYSDAKQKARLFGSAAADVSKPWQRAIFIERNTSPSTIKHELAHTVSAEFGVGPAKLAADFNPALIEGFAVAVENNILNIPVKSAAALVYRHGVNINLERLFSGVSFFDSSPAFGYLFAGAFVQYLINEYGFAKFEKFYASDDFAGVYGERFKSVETKFKESLDSVRVKPNPQIYRILFGSKSVFKRRCRHYVAARINFAENKFKDKEFHKAEKTYYDLFERFQTPEAIFGLVNTLLEENKKKEALSLLDSVKIKFEKSSFELRFLLLFAQVNILNGKYDEAEKVLTELKQASPFFYYREMTALFKALIGQGGKYAVKYLESNGRGKFILLKKLYLKTDDEVFLRGLIPYAEENRLKTLLAKGKNNFDSETNYLLAKYFLRKIDFDDAKYYSDKININDSTIGAYSVLNLKSKVEWFYKNRNLANKIKIL